MNLYPEPSGQKLAFAAARFLFPLLDVPVEWHEASPDLEIQRLAVYLAPFSANELRRISLREFIDRHFGECLKNAAVVLNAAGLPLFTFDLPVPGGVHAAGRCVHRGLALRYIAAYDIDIDRYRARIDILYLPRAAELQPLPLAA